MAERKTDQVLAAALENVREKLAEHDELLTEMASDDAVFQRLSDLEDRIKRMEKAVTSQLGARLQ